MGIGFLIVQTRIEDELPIISHVKITQPDGTPLYETDTDASGSTKSFPLNAPDISLTLDPDYMAPAYSVADVHVYADGYKTIHIHNVEIVDTQTAILPVEMIPLETEVENPDIDIDIDPVTLLDPTAHTGATRVNITLAPVALLDPTPRNQMGDPSPRGAMREVFIPEFLTVHLGAPSNTSARNVRVRFPDYIKGMF